MVQQIENCGFKGLVRRAVQVKFVQPGCFVVHFSVIIFVAMQCFLPKSSILYTENWFKNLKFSKD